MINLIVLLVKFMVSGIKLDIFFSGWDGFLEHVRDLLKGLKSGEEETE